MHHVDRLNNQRHRSVSWTADMTVMFKSFNFSDWRNKKQWNIHYYFLLDGFTLLNRCTTDTTAAISTTLLISSAITIWTALTFADTNMMGFNCWAITWLSWKLQNYDILLILIRLWLLHPHPKRRHLASFKKYDHNHYKLRKLGNFRCYFFSEIH